MQNFTFTPPIYYSGSKPYKPGDDKLKIKEPPITSEPIQPIKSPYVDLVPKKPAPVVNLDLDFDYTPEPSKTCKGFVWDNILFKKLGGKSRVDGSQGTITMSGGTKDAPETITYTDSSTGKEHKYTYRKITQEEINAGKLSTGENISKEQFKSGETYYVLVSVEGAKKSNHVEIYRLFMAKDGTTCHLYQDDNMDGAGKSSIDLSA